MTLAAGAKDGSGHATVTVTGPFYTTIPIASAGMTICSKIESCTGDLYCDGSANVDANETLDSLKAGLTCVRDGTNKCPNVPASVCCSNACEGVGVGSGNRVVSTTGVNPGTDSGAGALLLKCTQRNVTPQKTSGVNCSTENYSASTPFQQNYTTGTSTARVLKHCAGFIATGNKSDTVPLFAKTGQNFDCANWTTATAGGFAFALPAEQPSTLITGDGAQAGMFMGQ
jgi:hypothetical protein